MADVATSDNNNVIEAPNLEGVISEEHYDKWVAFSSDYREVFAYGDSIKEVAKQLSSTQKEAKPIFYKVPAKDRYYLPHLA